MTGLKKYSTRSEKKKERIGLEKILIGKMIQRMDYGDIREEVKSLGISWRQFLDKRHRAIWRAFETMDMPDREDRIKIIEDELYAAAGPLMPSSIGTGYDPVRGDSDTDFRRRSLEKLEADSRGLVWLERELEAAGVLNVIGGKLYLRAVAESALGSWVLWRPEAFAEHFKFVKGNGL